MQTEMPTKYKYGQNQPIENLYLKFLHHEKGKWVMPIESVMKVRELLKKYQPTQILELGTGIGALTAVMSASLENVRITTVEQNEKVMELAKELIPHELKEKITFHHTLATILKPFKEIDPFRHWSSYLPYPWIKWDFIVIDGPGPFIYNDNLVDLPNGDLITLLPKMFPSTKVLVQQRNEARRLYKRFLGWYLDILEETPEYTLYQRTNVQLNEDLADFTNSDRSRGRLAELGYFQL